MKHNLKITAILLAMFLITQFVGLYVVNYYSPIKVIDGKQVNVTAPNLPFGLETPEIKDEGEYANFFYSIVVAFVIAVCLIFFLSRFKAEFFLRLWFFVVIVVALVISLMAILPTFQYLFVLCLIIAIPLTYIKIFKRSFLVHNLTELFVYPGIAAVFVPILNWFWMVVLLILISAYDMWAVWKSGIMQKMAKYQMDKVKIFAGFFVPYISQKVRTKLRKMKKSELKGKKIRANIAILGGGDIIFPIITAGVMMKTLGLGAAILTIFGATLGLASLFFLAAKKKWYPAMPFITIGIIIAIIISFLIW